MIVLGDFWQARILAYSETENLLRVSGRSPSESARNRQELEFTVLVKYSSPTFVLYEKIDLMPPVVDDINLLTVVETAWTTLICYLPGSTTLIRE